MSSLSPAAAIASAWAWVKVPSATRDRIKARASSGVRFGAVPGCGSGSGSGSGCGTGSLSGFAFFSLADPLSGLAVFSSLAFFSGSGSGSGSVVGSGSGERSVGSSGVDWEAVLSGEGAGGRFHGGVWRRGDYVLVGQLLVALDFSQGGDYCSEITGVEDALRDE